MAEFFWNPSVGKYRRCNISVILHWPFLLQAHVDIKFISKEDRDGGQHCCGKLMKVLIMFPGIELLYTYGSDHHLILEVSVVILSWYFVLNYPILCYTYQQVCQIVEIHSRLPQWSPRRLETWWIHGGGGGGWCWWCLEGWDLTKISDRESGHQAEATLTTAIWVNWREESVYDGPLLTYHSGYSATMSHDTISAMDICKFSLLE